MAEVVRALFTIQRHWWRIPVWSSPRTEHTVLVQRAVTLTGLQEKALRELFKEFHATPYAGGWEIATALFNAFASPAAVNLDPESLLQWNPDGQAVDPPALPPEIRLKLPGDTERFLKDFYQKNHPQMSYQELALLWTQLGHHAMDAMINHEREVEFGFLTLHPTQMRPGWKNILLARVPGLAGALHSLKPEEKLNHALASGVKDHLVDPGLFCIHPNTHLLYSFVEVRHGKLWWKNTEAHEQHKRTVLGASQYARRALNTARKCFMRNLQALFDFVAQANRPCAELVDRRSVGSYELVPWLPKGRVRAKAPAGWVGDVQGEGDVAAARQTPPVAPAHESLPAVPDLQPAAENVRAGDPGRPEAGVRMLDAVEGDGEI